MELIIIANIYSCIYLSLVGMTHPDIQPVCHRCSLGNGHIFYLPHFLGTEFKQTYRIMYGNTFVDKTWMYVLQMKSYFTELVIYKAMPKYLSYLFVYLSVMKYSPEQIIKVIYIKILS